jgi:hypothetical protein
MKHLTLFHCVHLNLRVETLWALILSLIFLPTLSLNYAYATPSSVGTPSTAEDEGGSIDGGIVYSDPATTTDDAVIRANLSSVEVSGLIPTSYYGIIQSASRPSIYKRSFEEIPDQFGSNYQTPAPGFFRVGPPPQESEYVSNFTDEYYKEGPDFNPQSAHLKYAKTTSQMVMGWNATGLRNTLSALLLGVLSIGRDDINRRHESMIRTERSDPQKVIILNAAGLPSDLECLKRMWSGPPEDFDFSALTESTKATYCRSCWDEIKHYLNRAWNGEDISITNPQQGINYDRRISVYLNLLRDDSTRNEYCGSFNFMKEALQDSESLPWLHVNVIQNLEDYVVANNAYLFIRDSLRVR